MAKHLDVANADDSVTLTRNQVQFAGTSADLSDLADLAEPTSVQRQAFELIG